MSNIAIKAENLSKAYQLGQIGTGTISRDLERWYARVRGKEDPFLKIGETNDRTSKGTSDIVWSLKDINFEIEQGDAVGIIGRNGAGKSTLLKVLSRVTSPTTGRITGKGRIASLLEVGTGFHPELTGRENIYLNGAILGMRKREITRKFDEIVDFAGIERYIDTPVKRYSSGMYVRLAFAVAAHLESEILIVDEILAVGDAEFQKKCLGKMGDVSKGEGRTVLFVSHNMGSIVELCNKGLLMQNGKIAHEGSAKNTVIKYQKQGLNKQNLKELSYFRRNSEYNTSPVRYKHIYCIDEEEKEINILNWNNSIRVKCELETNDMVDQSININFYLKNADGLLIMLFSSVDYGINIVANKEKFIIQFDIKDISLSSSKYYIDMGLNDGKSNVTLDVIKDYPLFEINDEGSLSYWPDRPKPLILTPEIEWK